MMTWSRRKVELFYAVTMTSSNGTFSALLTLCAENSVVTGEFPSQRPLTRNFEVFFDLHLKTRVSKQSRRWWFEKPSRSFWRTVMSLVHCEGHLPVEWPEMQCLNISFVAIPNYMFGETVELSAIWDTMTLMWCHCNENSCVIRRGNNWASFPCNHMIWLK